MDNMYIFEEVSFYIVSSDKILESNLITNELTWKNT